MKKKTKANLEQNPLVTVVGGIALGAVAAALLPRTHREGKILGPLGRNMRSRARNAAMAAKDVGMEHLDNIGLNRDAATTQLRDLASKLGQAAGAAGSAAAKAARKKRG